MIVSGYDVVIEIIQIKDFKIMYAMHFMDEVRFDMVTLGSRANSIS